MAALASLGTIAVVGFSISLIIGVGIKFLARNSERFNDLELVLDFHFIITFITSVFLSYVYISALHLLQAGELSLKFSDPMDILSAPLMLPLDVSQFFDFNLVFSNCGFQLGLPFALRLLVLRLVLLVLVHINYELSDLRLLG